MLLGMNLIAVVAVIAVALLAASGVVLAVTTSARRSFADALDEMTQRHADERDAAVTAALRQVDLLNRSQIDQTTGRLQAELEARKDVIGANLDAVRSEMRGELKRLGDLVANLGEASAQRFGQVDESLRSHAEVAGKLADSTRTLGEALTNPQVRGQWGERMAEDVLRLAGFVENVNYRKQAQLRSAGDGNAGRPDFTFELPKGHVLHMDVKFPLAAYLRYLDATTDGERSDNLKAFLRDVRAKVKDLARRNYHEGDKPSVDYVLMFLPNEQLTGFIHEHDPALLDDALGQRVVMCSPLTLFAFLGVIRQAFDNFMVEQRSDEILTLVGEFGVQWRKYTESADKLKRHFVSVHNELDVLTSTRERALERPLRQIEALREQRDLPPDDVPSLHVVGDGG
jgi:DNA recombination protein RmuC